jgi:hypothetical protein
LLQEFLGVRVAGVKSRSRADLLCMHTQTQLSFARPKPVSEMVPTEPTAIEGGEPAPRAYARASNDTCTPTTCTISSRAWRKAELAKMESEYERRCQRLALMEKELQHSQVHPTPLMEMELQDAQVHPTPLFVAVLQSDLSTTSEKEEESRARDNSDHAQLSPEATLHPATITSITSASTDALGANAATVRPHTTDGPLIHHDRSLCGVADADSPSIMIPHASISPKANTNQHLSEGEYQAVTAGTAPSLDENAACAILLLR